MEVGFEGLRRHKLAAMAWRFGRCVGYLLLSQLRERERERVTYLESFESLDQRWGHYWLAWGFETQKARSICVAAFWAIVPGRERLLGLQFWKPNIFRPSDFQK